MLANAARRAARASSRPQVGRGGIIRPPRSPYLMQYSCVFIRAAYAALVSSTEAKDEWASSAATWDDDPLVQAYAQAAFGSLVEACDREGLVLTDAKVLDFGCGTGHLARALAGRGASVVAFDPSAAMFEQLQARLKAAGADAVEPVSSLTSAHDGFDLVVASSVLGFVPDLGATVRDLAARLKPGGWLVQWDWEAKPSDDDGLTQPRIRDAYAGAGLELRSLQTGFELELEGAQMAPLMGVARRPPAESLA